MSIDEADHVQSHELAEAIDNVDFFTSRWEGMAKLGKKLKALQALLSDEQAIRGRIERLQVREAAIKAIVAGGDDAQQRLDGINAELARHEAAMKAAHEQTVDGARTQAEEIVATARHVAEQHKVTVAAQAEAETKAKAEADAGEIAARQARLAELAAEIGTK
jgi:predicted  nucleic acid-binding Zn-ribbon protein